MFIGRKCVKKRNESCFLTKRKLEFQNKSMTLLRQWQLLSMASTLNPDLLIRCIKVGPIVIIDLLNQLVRHFECLCLWALISVPS